jgi:hypothetical protein
MAKNITDDRNLFLVGLICTNISHSTTLLNLTKFWHENIPSGNPVSKCKFSSLSKKKFFDSTGGSSIKTFIIRRFFSLAGIEKCPNFGNDQFSKNNLH